MCLGGEFTHSAITRAECLATRAKNFNAIVTPHYGYVAVSSESNRQAG